MDEGRGDHLMGVVAIVWFLVVGLQYANGETMIAAISAPAGVLFAIAWVQNQRVETDGE